MACPICTTPESTAIAAGIRAGALVLVLVCAGVFAVMARFAWRLRKLQSFDSRVSELAQDKGSA